MSRPGATLLLLAALAGCAAGPALTALRTVHVEASPDANSLSGTQIDLVFVFEPEANAALPATADVWFATREALGAAHPTMMVVPLRLPADDHGADITLTAGHRKAISVYSYASYLAPAGLRRCTLTPLVHAVLRLQHDHIDCAGK
jgi:type VI secretion system protein